VNPIICGITWGLTITWTVGAVAGCTAWIWVDLLPAGSSSGLAELLSPALDPADAALADKLVNLGIGIVFLATLPPVLRGRVPNIAEATAWCRRRRRLSGGGSRAAART
jgi:hypothetical protein